MKKTFTLFSSFGLVILFSNILFIQFSKQQKNQVSWHSCSRGYNVGKNGKNCKKKPETLKLRIPGGLLTHFLLEVKMSCFEISADVAHRLGWVHSFVVQKQTQYLTLKLMFSPKNFRKRGQWKFTEFDPFGGKATSWVENAFFTDAYFIPRPVRLNENRRAKFIYVER